MQPSIESWAIELLKRFHPDYQLNFSRDIEKDKFFNCFTLKVYNKNSELLDYYFVRPEDTKIAGSSHPFHAGLFKYFISAMDGKVPNLWIANVIIDTNGQAIDAQRFSVHPNQVVF